MQRAFSRAPSVKATPALANRASHGRVLTARASHARASHGRTPPTKASNKSNSITRRNTNNHASMKTKMEEIDTKTNKILEMLEKMYTTYEEKQAARQARIAQSQIYDLRNSPTTILPRIEKSHTFSKQGHYDY